MLLNCWVVFPSATTKRAKEAVEAWEAAGYNTLVYQDLGSESCGADIVRFGNFPGYYRIINHLVEAAMVEGAELVTCAADDMLPDPKKSAQEVALMYFRRFPEGNGVMQATGDMQGMDDDGIQASARICGSPAFGREWILRSYMGKGPFWDGYHSFFADEELYHVAKNQNLLYQEPDLTILHKHWSWNHMPIQTYHQRNQVQWEGDQSTFVSRKISGFPASGMLPI